MTPSSCLPPSCPRPSHLFPPVRPDSVSSPRVAFEWGSFQLSLDYPSTFSRIFQDFLRNYSELYKDFLRNIQRLSHDFLQTFSGLSQDFLRTFSGLSQEFLWTFPRRSLDFFLTFFGHSELGTEGLDINLRLFLADPV